MKSIVAVAAGALAAVVAAQEGLSECAGVCQTNMQGLYSDLGCGDQPEGNERDTCLCQVQDWSYGIIDCSRAACSAEEANQLINWAVQRCSELGIQLSIEGDSVTTSDATATVTGGDDTPGVTTITSSVSGVGEGTVPSPSPTGEAPAPSGVVTVISSDGEVITSTIAGESVTTETVTSSVPEDTATETATETTSVTTGTEDGSTETAGGDDAEATDAEGGDDDSAAVVPAAPLLGVLVTVGLAVVLL